MDVSDKSVIFTLKYIVVFIEFPRLARPEVGRGERERERGITPNHWSLII